MWFWKRRMKIEDAELSDKQIRALQEPAPSCSILSAPFRDLTPMPEKPKGEVKYQSFDGLNRSSQHDRHS